MKKRLFAVLFSLACALLCAFALVACGETDKEHVHKFVNYLYNHDATCLEDGTKTAKCKYCDATDTIPAEGTATGHTFHGYVSNHDATCVNDGTETAKCIYCDATDTRTRKGTATGKHTFETYVFNDDAGCGSDGTETAKCKYCDATDTRTKEGTATGEHNFDEEYFCTVCHEMQENAPYTVGLEFYPVRNGMTVVGYSVDYGDATDLEVKIPRYHDRLPVTKIYRYGFDGTSITSIEIPDSVTSIGKEAFSGCEALVDITIPKSVKIIESNAFCSCTALSNVALPDIEIINSETFYNCDALTEITIPSSVKTIGKSAFGGCSVLSRITIPSSVVIIGEMAFSYCSALTAITIPSNVKSLGKDVFYGSGLTNIVLSEGITDIPGGAFASTKITEITIPSSVTDIGENAFGSCKSLAEITIPDSVTSIGAEAFQNCDALTGITIPSSVRSLGDDVFINSGLRSVNISHRLDKVGHDIFYGCRIEAAVMHVWHVSILPDFYLKNLTVAGEGTLSSASFTSYDALATVTIQSGVEVESGAFDSCTSLTTVIMPDDGVKISKNAFTNCPALKYNDYDNARYLGNNFNKYVVLMRAKNDTITSCTIHEDTKVIASSAFADCKLAGIAIPNGVTSIGNSAFGGCRSLKSVSIGTGVVSIGDYAFNTCTSLTYVFIPSSVTSLYGTFENCTSLARVRLPGSITSIGSSTFSGCTSFSSIEFDGAKQQWIKLYKGSDWDKNTDDYTVACTDGTLNKGA